MSHSGYQPGLWNPSLWLGACFNLLAVVWGKHAFPHSESLLHQSDVRVLLRKGFNGSLVKPFFTKVCVHSWKPAGKTWYPQQVTVPGAAAFWRLLKLMGAECWNPRGRGRATRRGLPGRRCSLHSRSAFTQRHEGAGQEVPQPHSHAFLKLSPNPCWWNWNRNQKKRIPFTLVALPSIPAEWGIMESGHKNNHIPIKWG